MEPGENFVAGQLGVSHCRDFSFRFCCWFCMHEDVGEVFGGFEVEADGFTGYGWVVRIIWVGFIGESLVRVELGGRGGGGIERCRRSLRRR